MWKLWSFDDDSVFHKKRHMGIYRSCIGQGRCNEQPLTQEEHGVKDLIQSMAPLWTKRPEHCCVSSAHCCVLSRRRENISHMQKHLSSWHGIKIQECGVINSLRAGAAYVATATLLWHPRIWLQCPVWIYTAFHFELTSFFLWGRSANCCVTALPSFTKIKLMNQDKVPHCGFIHWWCHQSGWSQCPSGLVVLADDLMMAAVCGCRWQPPNSPLVHIWLLAKLWKNFIYFKNWIAFWWINLVVRQFSGKNAAGLHPKRLQHDLFWFLTWTYQGSKFQTYQTPGPSWKVWTLDWKPVISQTD